MHLRNSYFFDVMYNNIQAAVRNCSNMNDDEFYCYYKYATRSKKFCHFNEFLSKYLHSFILAMTCLFLVVGIIFFVVQYYLLFKHKKCSDDKNSDGDYTFSISAEDSK